VSSLYQAIAIPETDSRIGFSFVIFITKSYLDSYGLFFFSFHFSLIVRSYLNKSSFAIVCKELADTKTCTLIQDLLRRLLSQIAETKRDSSASHDFRKKFLAKDFFFAIYPKLLHKIKFYYEPEIQK